MGAEVTGENMHLMNHMRIIQEPCDTYRPPRAIEGKATPQKIWEAFHDFYSVEPVEKAIVLALSADHYVLGYHIVAIGTVNHVQVALRDVFKFLLLANAPAFVMVHNHPTERGKPTDISAEDQYFAGRVQQGAQLMDIEMLDFLVVNRDGFASGHVFGLLG